MYNAHVQNECDALQRNTPLDNLNIVGLSPHAANGKYEMDFPVDSSIKELIFEATGGCHNVKFANVTGNVVKNLEK